MIPGTGDGWPEQTGEQQADTRIPARLVYDSSRVVGPTGLRAGQGPSQVLYEAERFALDLHLTRERSATRMVLVGQIADRDAPSRSLGDVTVTLQRGDDVAASVASNELGEFYLEYDARQRVRLQIPVEGQRSIEVPLPRFEDLGVRERIGP